VRKTAGSSPSALPITASNQSRGPESMMLVNEAWKIGLGVEVWE